MEEQDKFTGLEIAIIGLAGRFPSSRNIEELWQNLKEGKELISFFSDEELREQGIAEETIKNERYVKAKGFLEDAELFDASFFEYTDREANLMDPQLRIFHECVQEALDHAGYGGPDKPVTGLFAGAGFNPFWVTNFLPEFKEFSDIFEISSLNAREYLATRVAYKLDLKGPAVTVQTACSTSLVAIHMGVQSLLAGECNMALAGGVSVLFPSHDLPRKYGMMSQEGLIIAPDGHCRPFDQNGIGFMGGDGTGVVVLKRLEDAMADGDNIMAVIKGSAINNDGNAKVGYTAPSIEGQSRVIKHALDIAEVDPKTIQYIETHGSGTPLGDPVEVEGLKSAYPFDGEKYCQLGSIKSNMGHTDAAAGVAGFIKTVLSINKGEVLPTVNHEVPNEKIDFVNSPFSVSVATTEWPETKGPRRAAVSSFGIGGTNAHIILEEGISQSANEPTAEEQLLLLSAKTNRSLKNQAGALQHFIKETSVDLADLAYTSQVGRGNHGHRHAIPFTDKAELLEGLDMENVDKKNVFLKQDDPRSIVFVFQGLGGQYVNMGLDLYETYPAFRNKMDEGFSLVSEMADLKLKDILFPQGPTETAALELQKFEVAQLATFTFECALADLLVSLDIKPDAMVGYSFGELVALHVGGGLSYRQALHFVVERGKVVESSLPGKMLSVPLPVENVKPLLLMQVEIAIDNGDSCVVSGPADIVDQFEEKLREDRILSMPIPGNFAMHSSMMTPVLPQVKDAIETLMIEPLEIPMASNITGDWVKEEITEASYWEQQLSKTVQFVKALQKALDLPNATLIEIGPGADLIATIKRYTEKEKGHEALNLIRPEAMEVTDSKFLLGRIRRLWLMGLNINWEGLHQGKSRHRIPMPGYAFDRKRYWFKDQKQQTPEAAVGEKTVLDPNGFIKNPDHSKWFYLPSWEKIYTRKANNFDGLYTWLVFSDGSDISTQLIDGLKQGHQKVVSVTIGRKFQQTNLDSYQLNPAVESQYQLLFNQLKDQELLPDRIVQLWNIDPTDELLQNMNTAIDRGYVSLINTALTLHQIDSDRQHMVFNITKNAHSVFGNESINPLATLSIGATKVLPIEFEHFRCLNIDLDVHNSDFSQLLLEEFKSPTLNHTMMAYRGKTKWAQVFRQEPIQKDSAFINEQLSGKKTYVIVGGMNYRSNLGYLFAKYLATQGDPDIIFLSRTVFPDRSEWDQLDPEGSLQLKTNLIKEIEAVGARVHTYVADLTDLDALQSAVDSIESEVGPISGVINVAAIMSGDSMDLIVNHGQKKSVQEQFDIKIKATLHVYEVFKDKALDFCIASSSLAGIMGPFASYAAGNNFIDTFTYWAADKVKGRWLAINWDHLLGFTDRQEDQPLAITHAEITESFERIISGSTHNQVVLSTTGIADRIAVTYQTHNLPALKKKSIDDWYFQPIWEPINLTVKEVEAPQHIWVLGQEERAGQLVEAYQRQGVNALMVGSNLHDENLLKEALQSRKFGGQALDELHFVAAGTENNSGTAPYYAALNVLKAWMSVFPGEALKIRFVIDQSQSITGEEQLNTALAALLGPAMIVGLENPLIQAQYLDVELEKTIQDPKALLSLPWGLSNTTLASRDMTWYQRDFKPTALTNPASLDGTIKSDGFYLLTGGLGGMAMGILKTFTDHTPANFLLIDNESFPVRADWESTIQLEDVPIKTKDKIQTLLNLEMLGTGIMIHQANVCDHQAVMQAFDEASQAFGKLNGLFHIAGGIDNGGIIQTRLSEEDQVLSTKVKGARALEPILDKYPVDFAMYFSSTGNIFTRLKFGQVSYNASHEFLDAHVHELRQKGIKAYTVNCNDWQGVGIAAEAAEFEIKDQQLSFEELLSVKPEEGLHAIMTILANDQPRVAISAYDVHQVIDFIDQIDFSDVSMVGDQNVGASGERPDLDTPYVAPANATERTLIEVFETTFGYQVGVEDDFFELGGDSIKAIAAISALQLQYQLDVPITKFFELRTARKLAVLLGEEEVVETEETAIELAHISNFHEPFALAPMQKAYIMGKGEHFEMGGVSSNVYQETTLQVSPELLNKAFNKVLKRHPMLTIAMLPDGTQQFQNVDDYAFPVTDLRALSEAKQKAALTEERNRLRNKVFDEQAWPLYEITLFRLTDKDNYMFFCLDHLTGDAASTMILIRDWGTALAQPDKALPEIGYTYKDYMTDFQANQTGDKYERSKKFWLDQLDDFPSAPELPYLVDPVSIQKPTFVRKRRYFENREWKALKTAAKKYDSTPSVMLCAIYAEVLSFWSNSQELALNLTLFNRYPFHKDINEVVGDFTTLVMLGLKTDSATSFKERVAYTRDQLLRSLDHRFYDGIDFIRELRRHRGLGTRAIMPYVFTSALFGDDTEESSMEDTFGFWSQQREDGQSISTTSQVYIDCTVSEWNGGMELVWDHVAEIFDDSVIQSMFDHMVEILEALIANKELPALVLPEAQLEAYQDFNHSAAPLPDFTSVINWFETTVSNHKADLALQFEGQSLNYEEFNERANQLARKLQKEGIAKGDIVGVHLSRSLDLMVAIYAVMKTGGVYLPLPTSLPEDRIQFILKDSDAVAVLVEANQIVENIKNISVADESIASLEKTDLNIEIIGDDPAYLIYTSGSTGQPKGVLVQHLPLVNRLAWMQKAYPITSEDKLLQKTPIGFDVSLWELFWWGLEGASLQVLAPELEKSSDELFEQIVEQQVTVVHFVPSMFELFLNSTEQQNAATQLRHLKYIFCSGEALQTYHVHRFNTLFADLPCRLINLYGPTEATIDVSHFDCTDKQLSGAVPIGKPIDNIELYVLDQDLKSVPHGVPGELYIGGIGLAAKYLNRQELTQSTFINKEMGRSARLYKTGDLVKYEAGELIFMDRIDDQVKLRGNRIELGEISHHLSELEGIESAVVIVRNDHETGKYLCAYLVGEELAVKDIRTQLLKHLPDYMVPGYYVYLDEIPLTANGKLNRKALPEPGVKVVATEAYIAPETNVQKQMVVLWETQLNVEKIGITDHFFDLGGDSFRGALLLTSIERELGLKISLAQLFKTPTIRELSDHLDGTLEHQQLVPAPPLEHYPLSAQQTRMFVLNQLSPNDTNYNLTSVKHIVGDLDIARMESSFKAVIAKNEIFRTTFHEQEGTYFQQIHEEVDFKIITIEAAQEQVDAYLKSAVTAFDLTKENLLRVTLIKVSEQVHYLVLDMHHIVTDLMSSALLIEELIQVYSGGQIADKALQYKDYAHWLAQTPVKETTKSYWLDQLKGELPAITLPTDFSRPPTPTYEAGCHTFMIPNELLQSLEDQSRETDATLQMTLMSAFLIYLHQISDQEDVLIGTPVLDVRPAGLERAMGMFVNTMVVRNHLDFNQDFRSVLMGVKSQLIAHFEHMDLPFEDLVELLDIPRDVSRNPIFDVLFVFQTINEQKAVIEGLQMEDVSLVRANANFDLSVIFTRHESALELTIDYKSALFEASSIERIAQSFVKVLEFATQSSTTPIKEATILTDLDRDLIGRFNQTDKDFGQSNVVQILFDQTATTPENTAVTFKESRLTYQELNKQSDQVAAFLQETHGIQKGDIVGYYSEKDAWTLPVIYGIMKSGAVYMPLSIEFPIERKAGIVEASQPKVLIAGSANAGDIQSLNCPIAVTEQILETTQDFSPVKLNDNDLAYIIYTSGSTGRPKGVMITHGALYNRLAWMQDAYEITGKDILLQKTPLSFDVSIWELFWWSFAGAQLTVLEQGHEKEPEKLLAAIQHNKVSVIHFVPSMLAAMTTHLKQSESPLALNSLQKIFASGEALTAVHVEGVKETLHASNPSLRLINLYGPTEATVDVTHFECSFEQASGEVPIGQPISNIQCHILNKNGQPCMVGQVGELCLSGIGLAAGYLNNETLTNQAFVQSTVLGTRIYKTGDLVRWMQNGSIEFLGRIDDQIKLRGYRIELGEINHHLSQHESIEQGFVISKGIGADQRLVAYYTGSEIEEQTLMNHLMQQMPAYMVPQQYVHLDRFPLSANGKINRKALPEPELSQKAFVAPKGETATKLAVLWSEVLELNEQEISADQSFFSLGGNSLKAVTLISKVNRTFGVNVPFAELFNYQTIQSLSDFIDLSDWLKPAKPAEKGERTKVLI